MLMPHSLAIPVKGAADSHSGQDGTSLVQASQQGDQDAFALLVQRHQRFVFNLSFRILQDYEDARESTQEAFLLAWQGLPSFRGEARFATWLYRIAYHCCLRQIERRKREQILQTVMEAEQTLKGRKPERQVEEVLEQRERQAAVREQMERLPARYRIVLILRHLQEMSYEEIAEVLTMPVGTVKTRLFRARNLLKERLLAQNLYLRELQEPS